MLEKEERKIKVGFHVSPSPGRWLGEEEKGRVVALRCGKRERESPLLGFFFLKIEIWVY